MLGQPTLQLDPLVQLRLEAEMLLQQDLPDREAHDSDSDDSSSDASQDGGLEDAVEDLETDTQLLMDLDVFINAPSVVIPKDIHSHSRAEPCWNTHDAFAQLIRERFPDAISQLVETLAQANLHRMQRCYEQREQHAQDQDTTELGSGLHMKVHDQSTEAGQTFKDSGVGTSLPANSSYADSNATASKYAPSKYAETVMSYAAGGHSTKIPPLSAAAKKGVPFECLACGKTVCFTKNKFWK